jgi:hypothetical protein
MTTLEAATEVATKRIPGFVARGRVRRLTCDWLDPEEGAEPLWADVRVDMTIEQVDELARVIGSQPSYGDLWEWLTPRVVGWNAVALDQTTGEYVPVQPPAEIGHDAFRVVSPVITTWLAFALKQAALGGDLGKGERRSGATPVPPSASA